MQRIALTGQCVGNLGDRMQVVSTIDLTITELIPWLPLVTTPMLLAAALWMGREVVETRLTPSVQFSFGTKLEAIRTELRASEERLKAQLRKRQKFRPLRSVALSALAGRQAALDKRRLEAVDQLWSAFNALEPAHGITKTMSVSDKATLAQAAEIIREANALQAATTVGQSG